MGAQQGQSKPPKQSSGGGAGKGCLAACLAALCCCCVAEEGCEACADCAGTLSSQYFPQSKFANRSAQNAARVVVSTAKVELEFPQSAARIVFSTVEFELEFSKYFVQCRMLLADEGTSALYVILVVWCFWDVELLLVDMISTNQ